MFVQPMPIENQRDKDLKVTPLSTYPHAAGLHSATLAVDEYEEAAKSVPIVFTKDPASGTMTSLCLLGIQQSRNLCVDGEGNWRTGMYIPAYVRCYPFLFMQSGEQVVPAIDHASRAVSREHGHPLFLENGEASDFLKAVLGMLKEYHEAQKRTRRFMNHMESLDLFEEMHADLKVGNETCRLSGFSRISEEKIAQLPQDAQANLMATGLFRMIAAHLSSLHNLETFARIQQSQA
ncbi:SapC family protein [Desulfurispirillum indicum]|uniref:SapC family protein n=1 Tax=Desulfurispirillum indicum TaxID=936456 RepID=UPI001CFBC9EA|nr:SapC family protein [Desulfurispirillum indicum]UCZ56096.1 SapC family protein [Desulfurispirillum indicum]